MILVLDPTQDVGERLCRQLKTLGFDAHVQARLESIHELPNRSSVELLVCTAVDWVDPCSAAHPGVAVVLATTAALEVHTLLSAVRNGARDCWQLPMSDEDLGACVRLVTQRQAHLLRELNAEFQEMRLELERDQRAGQYIQLGMLPPNPMGIGHFRLQHRVEPSLILSGDFIDYFQITDRYFACYVADVAGHGASSAFVTVLLKNFSRRLRREFRPSMLTQPGEVLAWINSELLDQRIDKHVAMFVGMIDTQDNVLHYSNAAHFPPAVLVGGQDTQVLEQRGKPLGLFDGAVFESRTISFPVDSRLVVFSDGVLDLIDATTLESKERSLLSSIEQEESLEGLWSCLDTSQVGLDDVSCLMISHQQ